MADDDVEVEEESGGSGGMKKILILGIIGFVLISASVGGTLYFLGFFADEEVAEENAGVELGEDGQPIEAKKPAIYFPLKPDFVVNFQARGRQRFLQVSVSIMSRDQMVIDSAQKHMPLIRNKLVLLFGGQLYDELRTHEGRELLRQQALEAVQEVLTQETGEAGVETVLFTNFVMQ